MALLSRSFIRKRAIGLVATASMAATSFALAEDPTRSYHVRGTNPIQNVADRPDRSNEQLFLSDNDAAMNKMMADMTIKPSGDVDRDFVEMMVPHHQGAIDMARAELKYGRNEQLRRMAQEIIVTQQQEIAAMVTEKLPKDLGDRYTQLKDDKEFSETTFYSTSDLSVVKRRFEAARTHLVG